ncbi:MAG: c-type cytochrome [Bacteroidota bacterium]|nr:c-type cytochrome [Bacteroidota bacterium]
MKKTFLIVITFISIISVAFTTFTPPKFKNLKILPKDISKQDLDSIMHNYSYSLGVKCDFCHVHNEEKNTWDMASDANPYKLIARKMMLMTTDINKKYFKPEGGKKNEQAIQTITCYSCHKGEAIPVAIPPTKDEEKENK